MLREGKPFLLSLLACLLACFNSEDLALVNWIATIKQVTGGCGLLHLWMPSAVMGFYWIFLFFCFPSRFILGTVLTCGFQDPFHPPSLASTNLLLPREETDDEIYQTLHEVDDPLLSIFAVKASKTREGC